MSKPTSGTLYGIGAGPGDPDLVTRKAWRIVSSCPVVAYPAPDHGESFARRIMAEAIPTDVIEIPIVIPMVSGRAPAQEIYDTACVEIASHLDASQDVSVLCEGDPLFYGSFMYILARLRDRYRVEIIPGVSSLTATAAAAHRPLAARTDALTVIAAPADDASITSLICNAPSVAIIKIGRHFNRVKTLIENLGLADRAIFISHASLPQQKVMALADAPSEAPYFSMVLIYQGDDPWIR